MAERAAGPLIVTAEFIPADFAWLEGLRRAHYPPERNLVPAHLTLFRQLPPSLLPELKDRLRAECRAPAPAAQARRIAKLDEGVAILIDSPELVEMRARLADALAPLLIPHDRTGWWPHVTIQNKATAKAAAALHAQLTAEFRPRCVGVAGLAIWIYRNGPWEPVTQYRFSRPALSRHS